MSLWYSVVLSSDVVELSAEVSFASMFGGYSIVASESSVIGIVCGGAFCSVVGCCVVLEGGSDVELEDDEDDVGLCCCFVGFVGEVGFGVASIRGRLWCLSSGSLLSSC